MLAKKFGVMWILVAAALGPAYAQTPLSSAFTYQGQLKMAGRPLDGPADFQFKLWDAPADGSMVGSLLPVDNVPVAGGLFTVELDFGVTVFDGMARWLEISIRSPAGAGAYSTLTPRQPLTAVPYSVQTRGVYRDASGNVGVGTTAPTERLSVAGTVESTSGGVRFPDGSVQTTARMSVPIGGVIDWWRPSASFSVPDRFQACDGSVVTDPDSPLFDTTLPDLTDKFVRGAASSTQVGETGGIETHSHAIDHDHPPVQSSAAADHAHQWAKWYTDYTGTDKYWVSFSDWGGSGLSTPGLILMASATKAGAIIRSPESTRQTTMICGTIRTGMGTTRTA